jgi:Cu(I)/Ag(I) efflux system membrane fusion protein
MSPALVNAARMKLKQWKLTDKQISDIEKSGKIKTNINILSNYNGYVMQRMIAEGDHVMEGDVLFEITDLSKVWVLLKPMKMTCHGLK